MFLQLWSEAGVNLLHQLNGLVGYSLLAGEDDLPEVVQSHQVQSVRHQSPPPLPELVVVVVHVTKEAVKTAKAVVRERVGSKPHHVLGEHVLHSVWLQIRFVTDKLRVTEMVVTTSTYVCTVLYIHRIKREIVGS